MLHATKRYWIHAIKRSMRDIGEVLCPMYWDVINNHCVCTRSSPMLDNIATKKMIHMKRIMGLILYDVWRRLVIQPSFHVEKYLFIMGTWCNISKWYRSTSFKSFVCTWWDNTCCRIHALGMWKNVPFMNEIAIFSFTLLKME